MREPVVAYVGLGGNLGDARAQLEQALCALAALPGTQLLKTSPFYRSAPVDAQGPDFINAVAQLQTQLNAMALLQALQGIENVQHRQRPYRNAPRTLDLDLLLYGAARINAPTLTVPHPRLWERAFVLLPLADIAPECVGADKLQAVRGQRLQRLE